MQRDPRVRLKCFHISVPWCNGAATQVGCSAEDTTVPQWPQKLQEEQQRLDEAILNKQPRYQGGQTHQGASNTTMMSSSQNNMTQQFIYK